MKVPENGLKLKFNHAYSKKRVNQEPRWSQVRQMIPLILRYLIYYVISWFTERLVVIDVIKTLESKQIYGVPIGGIGSGTIGRGYKGEFCRFQLRPGLYEDSTVDANQFIVTIKNAHHETIFHSLLSTFKKKTLKSWKSDLDESLCTYTGLYPKAWIEYDLTKYGIKLICRQTSPVIANNYKDTSLPCAVFTWHVVNVCGEARSVNIAFTFKNGTGNQKDDKKYTCSSKYVAQDDSANVFLEHKIFDMPCTYALSVKKTDDVTISKCLYFDPNSDGIEPWIQLKNNGRFEPIPDDTEPIKKKGEMGVGIAGSVTIPKNESSEIQMALVWHMPKIHFSKTQRIHSKYYTKFWSDINHLITHIWYKNEEWDKLIDQWHDNVLSDEDLPNWYKTAIFNESYYVSDGGSIWLKLSNDESKLLPPQDPRQEYGRFFYLEGHEYKMFNTYDVHFYASWALYLNWPNIQYVLQYDMRDLIFVEIPTPRKMLYDGVIVERKVANAVPHDVGDPSLEPFYLPDSYPVHDVSEWRDLNTKFVLQVFRDAFMKNPVDIQYLKDMYDACYIVMHRSQRFDFDDDGLIENGGMPDQTFDTWVMTGASAYCGSLWLAALFAMTRITELLNKPEDNAKFQQLLDRARKSFDSKLWNGKYYNFDCSEKHSDSIMADQLCGHWYLRCIGYNYEVFPKEKVQSALKTIYANNVLSHYGGRLGAVNGFKDGDVDIYATQSEEVWTGVTYAVASCMMNEGLVDEAFVTAGGMYREMAETCGLAFDTPEGLTGEKYQRSLCYMRPLSIWSIQLAHERLKKSKIS